MKLDLDDECKTKETSTSHSEEIKAKLNKQKSDDSKAVASNTIESYLKQKTEPTDNYLINQPEEFQKVELSINQLNCVETNKANDKQNIICFESIQENDEKVENEPTEFYVDSNDENIKDNDCLNIDGNKLNNEEDDKINLIHDANVYKHENTCIKNIDSNSSKIETNDKNVCVEVDTSIAPKDRKCVLVEISIDLIKQKLNNLSCRVSEKQKMKTRFYATIDPNKNQQAESELSREISKDMFSQVGEINQYNIFNT